MPLAWRAAWRLVLALACLAGSGCTVFGDYNVATEDAQAHFRSGDFDLAVAEFSEHLDDANDSLLYHLEAGLAAHVGKGYPTSRRLLATAYQQVAEYQERALVSASDVAQTVGSILVNEKTIPYTGAVFEQLLLQTYQARNYYLEGRRDEVLPEVLRTYDIQDQARKIYEAELQATEQEATNRRGELDVQAIDAEMREAYAYGEVPATPEDVYDPRYVRYLSAWLRDALADRRADYNAALVDLKRVAERFGDVPFVQRDLARLTAASGDARGAKQLLEQAGLEPLPAEAGSVALFFECGAAPFKEELKVIFPTYRGAAAFAMPIYERSPSRVAGARLIVGDEEADTVTLSSVTEMAFQYHRDRLPLMIAKQIIRIAAKVGVQEAGHSVIANQKGQYSELAAWGWTISASIWNVLSEQADLRCWRTLPDRLCATRLYLPPGTYPAAVVLLDVDGRPLSKYELGSLVIAPGRHRMINARAIGTSLYCDVPAEPYDAAAAEVEDAAAPAVAPDTGSEVPEAAPEAGVEVVSALPEPATPPTPGEPADLQEAQDAFLAGVMSVELLFEEDGTSWRANAAVSAAVQGEDERGPFLTVTSAAYDKDGARRCLELIVRRERIERAVLLVEGEDGWAPAPAGVFEFTPGGAGGLLRTGRGLEVVQAGRCRLEEAGEERAVTLILRPRLLEGAEPLAR